MASALTRHLSEVDSHHLGTYAGLGSRHHVTHWGDGAKEARVASATLRRPYYYLTSEFYTKAIELEQLVKANGCSRRVDR
jgi:hypothetical protein